MYPKFKGPIKIKFIFNKRISRAILENVIMAVCLKVFSYFILLSVQVEGKPWREVQVLILEFAPASSTWLHVGCPQHSKSPFCSFFATLILEKDLGLVSLLINWSSKILDTFAFILLAFVHFSMTKTPKITLKCQPFHQHYKGFSII